MLYNLLQAISIVHLSLIQPCTQVSVLLSNFSGGLLHINAARKAAVVHLMRW